MRSRAIPVLASAILAFGFLSCTVISDERNEEWTADGAVIFAVDYSFLDGGYFIHFNEIMVPTGSPNSSIRFFPIGDYGFISAIGTNKTFTKDFQYGGSTLAVTGTFTSSTACSGKTSYQGNSLTWTALAGQH